MCRYDRRETNLIGASVFLPPCLGLFARICGFLPRARADAGLAEPVRPVTCALKAEIHSLSGGPAKTFRRRQRMSSSVLRAKRSFAAIGVAGLFLAAFRWPTA